MRQARLPVSTTIVVALLVAACASPTTSAPIAPPPSGLAGPTGSSIASPSLPPSPVSGTPLVRGSAREISNHVVVTAPGPDGGLYVSIPARAAPALLALLDSTGRPALGWPVMLAGATSCDQLLPVEDGSIRVVCTMENPDGKMFDPIGAFAFDVNGRLLAGWPVALEGFYVAGQVVGDDLMLFVSRSLGDVEVEGQPSFDGGLVTIAADGGLENGARLTGVGHCCMWVVGRDGIAYGVAPAMSDPTPQERVSRITALDHSGIRPSWPVSFEGIASGPAFEPEGRLVLTVASSDPRTSRVIELDRNGDTLVVSDQLPIATAEFTGDTGGCVASIPQVPVVAQGGTIFVYSELDTAVLALDPSLAIMPGWPFKPATPLVRARPGFESEHEAGYCPAPVVPAIGPDSTLSLPLLARDSTVGGSIVAVGPDGRVRPGWPVELKSPGAEFWSVVVGTDGTVFALAIEPEAGNASSATILAIAPDSTVLWTTTIIEP